ncbi:MAG: DUF6485 family protein [Candidatus Cloacimonetes bacterium]|nr:DUF6485 family protein [Candidatus Cloacimonadota bacterium]
MKCKEKNLKNCNCSYQCDRKGLCCECLTNHRNKRQLPACYFPNNEENKYDRSIENFIRLYNEGKI